MAKEEQIKNLLDQATAICELLGEGDIECDDQGDRWLEIRSTEDESLWAEIRATYAVIDDPRSSVPVWKIEVFQVPIDVLANKVEHLVKRGS